MLNPEQLALAAQKAKPQNQRLLERLKKKKPSDLDVQVHRLHEEAFEEIDCLNCGNCCKSISPMVTERDVERIAKHFKIRPGEAIEKYLKPDEGTYIMNATPCPFLGSDNYCSIYESRPDACREYPHTDRRKFHQITGITLLNTAVCPAVFQIVERLQKIYTT